MKDCKEKGSSIFRADLRSFVRFLDLSSESFGKIRIFWLDLGEIFDCLVYGYLGRLCRFWSFAVLSIISVVFGHFDKICVFRFCDIFGFWNCFVGFAFLVFVCRFGRFSCFFVVFGRFLSCFRRL